MRKIDLIVAHCLATRESTDYSPEQLESNHKVWEFLRAGYNFYIRKPGEAVNLHPPEQIPAHTRGRNKHSIGTCYEGGLDVTEQSQDTHTQAQKTSLLRLIRCLLICLPGSRVRGHRGLSEDLDGDRTISPDEWTKQCPPFNAISECGELVYELRKNK